MATDERVLKVFDEATWAAFGAFSERSGGRTERGDGMLYVIGPHPSPIIVNTAFRTENLVPPATALEQTIDRYRSIGHGFGLMTRAHADSDLDEAADAAGWRTLIQFPGMVVHRPLPPPVPPPGAALRRMSRWRDLASAIRILRDGFGDDDDEREMIDVVFRAPAQFDAPGVAAFIGSQDGVDGSFAIVVRMGEAAVVGWVATVPELRRRGLGDLVTRAATNAGFELGARIVVLKASPMGLPVYERMGFETITRFRVLFPPVKTRT